jgi:hypothetical protein
MIANNNFLFCFSFQNKNYRYKENIYSIKMDAYCVKCKCKQEIQNPQERMTQNGRYMMSGTCPACSTKVNRFISNPQKK